MKFNKVKKNLSIFFILIGAIAVITEISSEVKNYYIQSIGLISLMLGIFWVNTKVPSKAENNPIENFEEEE